LLAAGGQGMHRTKPGRNGGGDESEESGSAILARNKCFARIAQKCSRDVCCIVLEYLLYSNDRIKYMM